MAEPAYLSEELDLQEHQRVGAALLARLNSETPTAAQLIEKLRRDGRDDAVLECALLLTLDEYRRVEEVFKQVEPPRRPQIRRRR